jgi:hypothetical protein
VDERLAVKTEGAALLSGGGAGVGLAADGPQVGWGQGGWDVAFGGCGVGWWVRGVVEIEVGGCGASRAGLAPPLASYTRGATPRLRTARLEACLVCQVEVHAV